MGASIKFLKDIVKMNPVIDHLNKSVWAKIAPSKIHGVGVIAIRDIPTGTVFGAHRFWKSYIGIEDLIDLEEGIKDLLLDQTLFTENELMFDHPNANVCLRALMNHSDTPNSDGERTLRDIKKDEEITENYKDCVERPLIKIQQEYYKFIK